MGVGIGGSIKTGGNGTGCGTGIGGCLIGTLTGSALGGFTGAGWTRYGGATGTGLGSITGNPVISPKSGNPNPKNCIRKLLEIVVVSLSG